MPLFFCVVPRASPSTCTDCCALDGEFDLLSYFLRIHLCLVACPKQFHAAHSSSQWSIHSISLFPNLTSRVTSHQSLVHVLPFLVLGDPSIFYFLCQPLKNPPWFDLADLSIPAYPLSFPPFPTSLVALSLSFAAVQRLVPVVLVFCPLFFRPQRSSISNHQVVRCPPKEQWTVSQPVASLSDFFLNSPVRRPF